MKTHSSLTIAKNSAANLARLAVGVLLAVLLPPFLTRRLSHDMYAAWVLILQLSAYAAVFEIGLQSAISKFVAHHDATEDHAGASSVVSTAMALLTLSAGCALIAIFVLAWQIPRIFHQLTPILVHQVRLGILLVGSATALALPTTALASSFEGIQRNKIPMAIQAISQALQAIAIILTVLLHGSLIAMGCCVATATLGAGIAQIAAWKRYLPHFLVSAAAISKSTVRLIARYCAEMSVWSFGMLLVSGLDTVIVGHYQFGAAGYYAIAASLTNFMILVVGAVFGPLLPAASALGAANNRTALASLTLRSTRYCALLILLTALPILLFSHSILSVWVGPDYALHSAGLAEILVLGNMIRLSGMPYAIVVAGNGMQRYGSLAAIVEACVNLGSSIFLASRIGATGVALGTLIGSFFSIGLHLLYSVRRTHAAIPVSGSEILRQGLSRSIVCAIPVLTYAFLFEHSPESGEILQPAMLLLLTGILVWTFGLKSDDRKHFMELLHNRLLVLKI